MIRILITDAAYAAISGGAPSDPQSGAGRYGPAPAGVCGHMAAAGCHRGAEGVQGVIRKLLGHDPPYGQEVKDHN